MASQPKHRCDECGDFFQHTSSLTKHSNKKVCFQNLFVDVTRIRDCIQCNNDIVSALPSKSLKFNACRKLGVFQQKFYPLTFSKLPNNLKELENFLPTVDESVSILTQILTKDDFLILPTNARLIVNDKMYDLTSLPLPTAEDLNNLPISIESSSNYIIVKLKNNAPAKASINDSTQNDQNIPSTDNEIVITSPPKRPRYTIRDTYNSETNRVTLNFERFSFICWASYTQPTSRSAKSK